MLLGAYKNQGSDVYPGSLVCSHCVISPTARLAAPQFLQRSRLQANRPSAYVIMQCVNSCTMPSRSTCINGFLDLMLPPRREKEAGQK